MHFVYVPMCVLNCLVMSDSLQSHGPLVALQALLSMGFSRQKYWSGLQGSNPGLLH